jgi:hypothetical protein
MGLAESPRAVVLPEVWTRDAPWFDRDDADIVAYVAALPNQPGYDLAEKPKGWREMASSYSRTRFRGR